MSSTNVTVSEARAALPALLDRVAGGDEITITRHGRAVAVLVRPDALRTRRAAAILQEADELAARLERARARPLPATGSISAERADELVAEIYADRRSGDR